ncbi:MAG: 2-C-methyl-D-erythritol 4-phosphate cytidylyltransferase [Planctomycetota bacterium]|nr:MAG: 2-C-methyl-D-erythritol 4-phosphate cytidylyltransferase [Planctomycetota bacterium]
MSCALVLAAAGGGSRLGGVAKQVRPLAGRPVLNWSLSRFHGLVDEVVVVSSQPLAPLIEELLRLDPPPVPWQVVLGGATRLHSVWAGIQALGPKIERILVHDAARPLVQPKHISACIQALTGAPGAVLAQAVYATVKRCNETLQIRDTIDRRHLYLAQTPQAFRAAEGRQAFAQAITAIDQQPELAGRFTDDVAVLEWAGLDCVVVPGVATNIKITTTDDWDLAEAILGWEHQLDHQ